MLKIGVVMEKITYEMFKSLFDYLVKKGTVIIKGNKFETKDEIVKSVFDFFTLWEIKELEGYAKHKLWQCPEFGVFEYYLLYHHIYGREPFDLMEWINRHLEVGATYGWRGNPFFLCVSKKIEGNTLKVSSSYICGVPQPVEEDEYIFSVNDYKSFEENANKFTNRFDNKNMQHPNLIVSLQATIEACQKGLEVINGIKDEYEAQREKMEKIYINGKEHNLY